MTDFETILKKDGVLVYKNRGVSMMPLLRQDKDLIVIKAQNGNFQKNDAVLYKRESGQYVLHRITKVNGDGSYIIIGDNCPNYTAENIKDSQILGILTEIKRDGKIVKTDDFLYKVYLLTVPSRRVLVRIKGSVRFRLSKIYHKIIKKRNSDV